MQRSHPVSVASDRDVWRAFRYHSRTFSFAARLLPRPIQQPTAILYLFCRSVDTIADQRILEIGQERARDELAELRKALTATLKGHPPDAFLWRRLHEIHAAFDLPPGPLFELIDGAAWDLDARPIVTMGDLLDYSNLVGGSVGAMMLPFLLHRRETYEAAEGPARALGLAMQLTNIVRDVGEDLQHLGRTYLPLTLLSEHGLTPADLDAGTPPPGYPLLLERVMGHAEALFEEGLGGLHFLDRRVQGGIRAAALLYREILNEVRALHYNSLGRRAFVPFYRKCRILLWNGYYRRKARYRPQEVLVTA